MSLFNCEMGNLEAKSSNVILAKDLGLGHFRPELQHCTKAFFTEGRPTFSLFFFFYFIFLVIDKSIFLFEVLILKVYLLTLLTYY